MITLTAPPSTLLEGYQSGESIFDGHHCADVDCPGAVLYQFKNGEEDLYVCTVCGIAVSFSDTFGEGRL